MKLALDASVLLNGPGHARLPPTGRRRVPSLETEPVHLQLHGLGSCGPFLGRLELAARRSILRSGPKLASAPSLGTGGWPLGTQPPMTLSPLMAGDAAGLRPYLDLLREHTTVANSTSRRCRSVVSKVPGTYFGTE